MKTERRRELHTNELAQQIDQIGDYVRENASRLIAVGTVVIVLVIGVAWYIKGRQSRVMNAWATLADTTLAADPVTAVSRYREVATESTHPGLTIAAWMQIGETSMGQLVAPGGGTDSIGESPKSAEDWRAIAVEAYEQVVQHSGARDTTAKANALMMLGVLAEDRGDFEKAREFYTQIIQKPEYAQTPFPLQAEYRMEGLARWSEPVTFPPAAVTVPVPDDMPSAQFVPPSEAKPSMTQTIDLELIGDDADATATNETPETPKTQPADEGDGK